MATEDEFNSLKCRYASKRCWNLRAIKRNGERHNLCELHRQKANSNQRRLDKKRKAGQALGLPTHLALQASKLGGFHDSEQRMRMRASIALKLEQELGGMPLTTQFIRPPPPSLAHTYHTSIGLPTSVGMGAHRPLPDIRGGYTSSAMDTYPSEYSSSQTAPWMHSSYPRSPRTMLRAAALAKRDPLTEPRGWVHHSPLVPPKAEPDTTAATSLPAPPSLLLPPIATAMARSGDGLISSAVRQETWQPERRPAPLATRSNI